MDEKDILLETIEGLNAHKAYTEPHSGKWRQL